MEQPTIGAAATERWSVRGPGLRHGVGPLTASEFESLIKFRRPRRVSGDCFTAHPDGGQGWADDFPVKFQLPVSCRVHDFHKLLPALHRTRFQAFLQTTLINDAGDRRMQR